MEGDGGREAYYYYYYFSLDAYYYYYYYSSLDAYYYYYYWGGGLPGKKAPWTGKSAPHIHILLYKKLF